MRKENLAAFVRSTPRRTEVDIVAPDREIPGNIAMACEIPMIKALINDTFLLVFFALSAKRSRRPVISNIKPTNNTFPLKNASSCSSIADVMSEDSSTS